MIFNKFNGHTIAIMDPDSKITFEIPSSLDLDSFIRSNNYTLLFSQLHSADSHGSNRLVKDLFSNRSKTMSDIEYERFMNEVWITLVLVLFILSIVFCLCSCLLYHKFRQWKRSGKLRTVLYIQHQCSYLKASFVCIRTCLTSKYNQVKPYQHSTKIDID